MLVLVSIFTHKTYNLVNHHQYPRLSMLHALHVTEDVCTIPMVKSTIRPTIEGCAGKFGIGSSRAEKEYICSSVVCNQVDVVQNAGPDAIARSVDNEIWIDIYYGRSLQDRSAEAL